MEREKKNKPRHWLWIPFLIENGLILLLLVILGVRAGWNYCEENLFPKHFEYMHVHSYPDKLVYVIGKDTELDLTGGQVCFSEKYRDLHGYSCEWAPEPDVEEYAKEYIGICDEIHSMREYAPDEADFARQMPDLDFTKPGIYNVVLQTDDGLKCSFPIQVVERQPVK